MDFSQDWKSLLPIGSVFSSPLLLSNPTLLGPLLFNPNLKTLNLLFSFPSLSPPFLNPINCLSLPRFLSTSTSPYSPILPSTASSISSSLFSGPHHQQSPQLLNHNRLQLLRCSRESFVVFFSTGSNHDQVGFLLVCVKGGSLVAAGGPNGGVLTAKKRLDGRIVRILVNPVEGSFLGSCTVGYLLVYTLYSVHWFRFKVGSGNGEKPVLGYLGCKLFKTCAIVGACWSPHLSEESVVLLEDGSLFLFDLESDCGLKTKYFEGTRLKVLWDGVVGLKSCGNRLGCEFSWHPRILVVAHSDAVFLVDWRYGECKVTCLANVEMLGVYASVENDQFIAFSKAVSDSFHYVLVSKGMLVLCDVRKPLVPLLQWAHGLDKPCYVDVFHLSELRSNSMDDTHEQASLSGFGIVLGSFWNCEFNLFCYGPPLHMRQGSIASELSKFSKSVYAWELPSDLLLSGNVCRCGSCLLREEFWRDSLPDWISWQQKKDIVLGFGILGRDISSLLFEPDEFGGFTLIRLMSSGKLESQRYYASCSLVRLEASHQDTPTHSEDNLLYDIGDGEYKFPRRFKYLKLNYLRAFLNGSLFQILHRNIFKPSKGPQETESFSLEFHEILCQKLRICGFDRFRTTPAITVVFNGINFPTSIHEVALSKIWASLPIEFLQLAFSSYSEFLEVLLDQRKVSLEFLEVPELPQLPPFFLRKPSRRSNKWSHKVQRTDAPVGPVLPLPILVTLHEIRNGCLGLREEMGGFSPEVELSSQYDEVMQMAREMSVSDLSAELPDDNAVSLDDDRDDIPVNAEKHKSFFLHRPIAGSNAKAYYDKANCYNDDDRYAVLISKIHKSEPPIRCDKVEAVGQELFDDLCPIDLKFDGSTVDFGSQELRAYKLLKRQFSKWQRGFNPYQEFCSRFPTNLKQHQ